MILQEKPELVVMVAESDEWLSEVCKLCQRQLKARPQRMFSNG